MYEDIRIGDPVVIIKRYKLDKLERENVSCICGIVKNKRTENLSTEHFEWREPILMVLGMDGKMYGNCPDAYQDSGRVEFYTKKQFQNIMEFRLQKLEERIEFLKANQESVFQQFDKMSGQ